MIDNIIRADKEFSLFEGVTDITVAVSGGADSIALLHGLNSIKNRFGFSLTVAHYHHGIRGDEADRDLKFVEEFADLLRLPFVSEKGDAPKYAKENALSLETAARDLRYDFLNRVATGVIATAHTASDNIETVLFNLTRGASLGGMCGIPPKRGNIIRPLIFCDRECVERYCADNNLSFVTDSTNLIDDCSRNIIRHRVVPVLKEINSACVKNVSNMTLNLYEDNSYINTNADIEFEKRSNEGSLDIMGFDELPASIVKRVIILFFKMNFGILPDKYHIERIYDVCLGRINKTSVSLDKSAVKNGEFLVFADTFKTDREFSVEKKLLSIEEFKKLKNVHELLSINAVDYDKIIDDVRQIQKNNSDQIKLSNSSVTKTVKKLLTERKIPIELRRNLPVFADSEGIVWLYNIGVADRVKVDKTTKTVLYFYSQII